MRLILSLFTQTPSTTSPSQPSQPSLHKDSPSPQGQERPHVIEIKQFFLDYHHCKKGEEEGLGTCEEQESDDTGQDNKEGR